MSEGSPFATEVMRRHILNALFVKFRVDEGAKAFDLDDPVPRGDVVYDAPNTGYFEIFSIFDGGNAAVDPIRPINVASDGNQQLCRRVIPDEKQYKKETPGVRGRIHRPSRTRPLAGWR